MIVRFEVNLASALRGADLDELLAISRRENIDIEEVVRRALEEKAERERQDRREAPNPQAA